MSALSEKDHITASAGARLLEELLTLKYLSNRSASVRKLAQVYAEQSFDATIVRLAEDPAAYKTKSPQSSGRAKKD